MGMSYLAPFTAPQLAALEADAQNRAIEFYTRANDITRQQNELTGRYNPASETEWQRLRAQWQALFAAGDEQHELAHRIRQEITDRSIADA